MTTGVELVLACLVNARQAALPDGSNSRKAPAVPPEAALTSCISPIRTVRVVMVGMRTQKRKRSTEVGTTMGSLAVLPQWRRLLLVLVAPVTRRKTEPRPTPPACSEFVPAALDVSVQP